MAKRAKTKAARRAGKSTRRRKAPVARRSVRRPSKKAAKKAKVKRPHKALNRAPTFRKTAGKVPRLDRARRVFTDAADPQITSSLDVGRYVAAARSGRKALGHSIHEHTGMTPALTGGDVDADWENAYFSGDEAPGGDNLTPDQENVEDMGEALGVSYQANEELKGSDKVVERDKHRWELDPASADDYHKDRS